MAMHFRALRVTCFSGQNSQRSVACVSWLRPGSGFEKLAGGF